MITARMLGIASALLLGLALFAAAAPEDDPWEKVVEVQGEAEAWIDDIVLYDLPAPVTGRSGDFGHEQLVEGHSVFVTLDITLHRNQTEGAIKVTGFVNCTHEAQFKTRDVGGVDAPYRLDYAWADCAFAETVFVRPSTNASPTTWFSPLYATGNTYPLVTPAGEQGTMTEYAYQMFTQQPDGTVSETTLYTWETPVMRPWLDEHGRPKSFLAPIPKARLTELDVDRYDVLLHDDPRLQR